MKLKRMVKKGGWEKMLKINFIPKEYHQNFYGKHEDEEKCELLGAFIELAVNDAYEQGKKQ